MAGERKTYLKEGQVLRLSDKPDGTELTAYRIQSYIGEGGSAVCYAAVRESDQKTGKLKEFYPWTADHAEDRNFSMERHPNGSLSAGGALVKRFDEMRGDYVSAFALLNETIAQDDENEILKNYIQDCEILYGESCGPDRRGTVYIWTAGKAGQGLDEYLEDVRNNPGRDPDARLHEILGMTYTLTDCIRALHIAGLMHLDIKPSNFLVMYDSSHRIRPSGISLFDINTLYPVRGTLPLPVGTYGFSAPELYGTKNPSVISFSGERRKRRFSLLTGGRPDNRADIFSIGALLFYALVITDEIPDGYYRTEYYDRIDELVRGSALFAEAESGKDEELIRQIVNILKNCLAAHPSNRYQSCSRLLGDLEKAELYAKQYAVKKSIIGQNKRFAIIEENEQGISDPVIVMQKLLYEHPLYHVLREHPEKKDIHVLTIGSGEYGQRFIDICLQTGQMDGYDLKITALGTAPDEDRSNYLKTRPEMSRFVNVDGSMAAQEELAYAKLSFRPYPAVRTGEGFVLASGFGRGRTAEAADENRSLVRAVLAEPRTGGQTYPEEGYDYIFIALGSDALNRAVAELFARENSRAGEIVPVCYISESKEPEPEGDMLPGLFPVYINETITPQTIHPQLEQMAFHTHICYKNSMNFDRIDELKKFRGDRYNYRSSLASALSIPYKLYSVGIDENDPQKAADRFRAEILSKKDSDAPAKRKFDALVVLEHRRWVIYMAADGWRAPADEFGQLDLRRCEQIGKAKDADTKTHACMVRSTAGAPLSQPEYTASHYEKWDDPVIDPRLDDLDRMSVELCQRLRRRANEYKRQDPLNGTDAKALSELAASCNAKAVQAFRRFRFCLKNILNGAVSYTRQYEYYENAFLAALEAEDAEIRDKAKERLSLIRKSFVPVIAANMHTDYKAYDAALIEKIPFILSWQHQSKLTMAFKAGNRFACDNDSMFANAASATLLSPDHIQYLCYFRSGSDAEFFTRRLEAVINYLAKRNVHSGISIAAAADGGEEECRLLAEALQDLLEETGGGAEGESSCNARLEEYVILPCSGRNDAAEVLLEFLKEHGAGICDGSVPLFDSARENAWFTTQILKSDIPYFELERGSKMFTEHVGCDFLQYLSDDTGLRINDMFALMNAEDTHSRLPDFTEEYDTLWNFYQESAEGWNALCRMLQEHEQSRAPAVKIPLNKEASRCLKTQEYPLPGVLYSAAMQLVSALETYGVVEKGTEITLRAGGDYLIRITAGENLHPILENLFAAQNLIRGLYGIEAVPCRDYDGETLRISYPDLQVNSLCMDAAEPAVRGDILHLLENLQKGHFITQLDTAQEGSACVSFFYASASIRRLLTSTGEILKLHTYYQVLETGFFDDVACDYEFRWEDGGVTDALDLVLTKGFRSMIITCTDNPKLEAESYHKLYSIADHFGIGSVRVLIGNTWRNNDPNLRMQNELARTRGSQMGIITISGAEEIQNIGETLAGLIS